jgi:hypothetical protein
VVCTDDLSNVHAADFHVGVTVKTSQSGLVSLINQRSACASTGTFWDLRLSSGNVRVEANDGTKVVDLTSSGVLVNDGRAHDILVQRRAGSLTIHVDGTAVGSVAAAISFGALPALTSGSDVCDGHSSQVKFTGTMTGLCIASP